MLDDNMPYRRILEPEASHQPLMQQHVPRTKESNMNEDYQVKITNSNSQYLTERKTVIFDGHEEVRLPLQMARNMINLRPEIAHKWVRELTLDVDSDGPHFLEEEVKIVNDPEFQLIRDALNFSFLELDPHTYRDIFERLSSGSNYYFSEESTALLLELRRVLSLFPELDERLGNSPSKKGGLLKLPEVARILSVSESKVRKLVAEGLIEHTKSQGETGHYRFTRSAVREYAESRKVG